jgi:hypothetical protein
MDTICVLLIASPQDQANFVGGEMKDPAKGLPRAIHSSMAVVVVSRVSGLDLATCADQILHVGTIPDSKRLISSCARQGTITGLPC